MKISEFNALSKSEKRIAIAKDALVQIKTKKIIATNGHYLSILSGFKNEDSLQKKIDSKGFSCQCCAKGALFISCVRQVNQVNMTDNWSDERFQKSKSKDYFSVLQLDMIETAFEGQLIQDSTGELEERMSGRAKNTPLGKKM